jgi:hypothetical protein
MMLKITTDQGVVRYVAVNPDAQLINLFNRLDKLFSGHKFALEFCPAADAGGTATVMEV